MERLSIVVDHLALLPVQWIMHLLITLFFDLSSFHMQPGIIAGDEVKHNRGYIMSFFQFQSSFVGLSILTDFAMLSRAVMTLLVMGC